MRFVVLSLLLCVTGCATTSDRIAQRRAEIARYREEQKNPKPPEERPAPAAEQQGSTPPAQATETPVSEARPAGAQAPASSAQAPAAPGVAAGPVGPREGLFGLRASLFGGSLSTGTENAGSLSTVGIRYFFSDSVGLNLDGGFAIATAGEVGISGLSLGVGLDIYGGTAGAPLRPFFALQGGISTLGNGQSSITPVTLGVGGGLEYWVAPSLSLSTRLMLGMAIAPGTELFVIGTFQPGLGVTLYVP